MYLKRSLLSGIYKNSQDSVIRKHNLIFKMDPRFEYTLQQRRHIDGK